jgi:hypothetical protein
VRRATPNPDFCVPTFTLVCIGTMRVIHIAVRKSRLGSGDGRHAVNVNLGLNRRRLMTDQGGSSSLELA